MDNTDKLLELIARRSEEQLSDKLTVAKRKSQQDLLSLGCNLIALQTTALVMASVCGVNNEFIYK